MRIKFDVKAHSILGPRVHYPLREVEVRENEIATIAASGKLVPDGEGAIYWIEVVPTSDGGQAIVYNSEDNSGSILGGGYSAKAADGKLYPYDPPKKFSHGVYAAITNATVNICYRPWARNLQCQVTTRDPSLKNLVCRLTVLQAGYIHIAKPLVCQVTVLYASTTKNLVTRVTVLLNSSKSLTLRVTTYKKAFWPLKNRVTVTS